MHCYICNHKWLLNIFDEKSGVLYIAKENGIKSFAKYKLREQQLALSLSLPHTYHIRKQYMCKNIYKNFDYRIESVHAMKCI